MNERPILFNGPMVRALLDGSKTQTRRALKVRCQEIGERDDGSRWPWSEHPDTAADHWHACPYGQPGDRLWVRETWGVVSNAWDEDNNLADWVPDRPATAIVDMPFGKGYYSGHVIYAADGSYEWAGDDDGGGEPRSAWHPSIHMPRAASRTLLEIVSVHVERLNHISNVDALTEGISSVRTREWDIAHFPDWRQAFDDACARGEKPPLGPVPSVSFQALWEQINGTGSWDANPWVWVIEFKRVAP
jgi:hypothetical protein